MEEANLKDRDSKGQFRKGNIASRGQRREAPVVEIPGEVREAMEKSLGKLRNEILTRIEKGKRREPLKMMIVDQIMALQRAILEVKWCAESLTGSVDGRALGVGTLDVQPRNKSLADLIKQQRLLMDSLKLSEEDLGPTLQDVIQSIERKGERKAKAAEKAKEKVAAKAKKEAGTERESAEFDQGSGQAEKSGEDK